MNVEVGKGELPFDRRHENMEAAKTVKPQIKNVTLEPCPLNELPDHIRCRPHLAQLNNPARLQWKRVHKDIAG